jgi:aminodeoxyfutalosine deaminase
VFAVTTVESFLAAVPKVELHLHLVGSASPATVAALARRHPDAGVPTDERALAELFRFRDFPHFIEVYGRVNALVTTAEDIAVVVEGAAADLARQRVAYVEMTVTPAMHALAGVPYAAVVEGLDEGRRLARSRGVDMAWIYDIPGQHGRQAAEDTLRWAVDEPADGLVAFGLAGAEAGVDRAAFVDAFAAARAAGLPGVPHAGEGDGPASIWAAIEHLAPARIGHGVRAIEDPALVEHLVATGLPLEVCPSSNVATRVFPSIEEHSVGPLMDAGVVVTVNSDDPPMFGTTLTDEYRRLALAFDLGVDDLAGLVANGVRASFLPETRQAELLAGVEAARLGSTVGGPIPAPDG